MPNEPRDATSGVDYLRGLRPPEPAASGFVGIAKPADEDGHFLFAHPSSCHRWVKIAAADVERVEPLGRTACAGHNHDLVRLTMAAPATPQAEAFRQLAELHHDLSLRFTNGAVVAGFKACPTGQHACWNEQAQQWDCCPD